MTLQEDIVVYRPKLLITKTCTHIQIIIMISNILYCIVDLGQ